jgi:uncharacterized damage-inducible protein DinB
MNSRELFLASVKSEAPAFRRVLEAVPADKLEYTPHPKSRTAGSLAMQLGMTPNAMLQLLETGKLQDNHDGPKLSLAQAMEAGSAAREQLEKKLEQVDDKTWNEKKAQMLMPDGTVVWEATLGNMCWGLLHDAIHHRGQLSSYLRPMGAKVPSIYGPSADDMGGM